MIIAYIGFDIFYDALWTLHKFCEIMEIFTCEVDNEFEFNSQVTAFAKNLKIPYKISPITPDDINRLQKNGCEAVICAGYYHKIPTSHTLPIVNIHPAMLPVGRGAWPTPLTILKQLPVSGVTIHKLTEEYDAGDILLAQSFLVAPDDNLELLTEKIKRLLPDLIEQLVTNFKELYDNAVPQGKGEYWATPIEADWTITPDMNPAQIDLVLRAFYGFECILKLPNKAFSLVHGKYVSQTRKTENCFLVAGGVIEAEKVKKLEGYYGGNRT